MEILAQCIKKMYKHEKNTDCGINCLNLPLGLANSWSLNRNFCNERGGEADSLLPFPPNEERFERGTITMLCT